MGASWSSGSDGGGVGGGDDGVDAAACNMLTADFLVTAKCTCNVQVLAFVVQHPHALFSPRVPLPPPVSTKLGWLGARFEVQPVAVASSASPSSARVRNRRRR